MEKRFFASIVLAIGVAAAGFFVGNGIKFVKRFDRIVSVKGLAEKIVKSTDATWKIDYTIAGDDLKSLNGEAANSQNAILKFLRAKGFEESEIQKTSVRIRDSLADLYSAAAKKNVPRYSGRGSFMVGSKKVDLVTHAAEQADELLNAGVTVEQSLVGYHFSNINAIKPEMLKEATATAREAANSFATNSNSNLGGIRSASQGIFTIAAPFSEFDAESSIMKKVRVVTEVSYFLN